LWPCHFNVLARSSGDWLSWAPAARWSAASAFVVFSSVANLLGTEFQQALRLHCGLPRSRSWLSNRYQSAVNCSGTPTVYAISERRPNDASSINHLYDWRSFKQNGQRRSHSRRHNSAWNKPERTAIGCRRRLRDQIRRFSAAHGPNLYLLQSSNACRWPSSFSIACKSRTAGTSSLADSSLPFGISRLLLLTRDSCDSTIRPPSSYRVGPCRQPVKRGPVFVLSQSLSSCSIGRADVRRLSILVFMLYFE